MEKRNADGKFLDQKLRKLEIENIRLKASEFKTEKNNEEMRVEMKKLKAKSLENKEDAEFYHKSALESKKKMKLVKIALKRL
jgi:hypothetical protein